MTGRLTNKKEFTKENIKKTPKQSGIYVIHKRIGKPYVGSAGAGRLRERIKEHFDQRDIRGITKFQYRTTTSTKEARKLEKEYRDKLNPKQRV